MADETNVLGAVDYFFFSVMLLISAGIGVYFRFAGGKQQTTEEFLLAGKNMPILPVAFSVMATSFSANTILGIPADVYTFGTHIAFLNIGSVVGFILSGYLFLPVFFKVQVTTAYEYLEKRFGKNARLITSITFVPQMMLSLALVLYAPALALSAVTSLSTWVSVISIGLVCTFYCTLGGMKAVLWTDVFQAILMYLCLFAVLIKGSVDVGGIANVVKIARDGGRLLVPGTDIDPTVRYTMWNLFLQGCIIQMAALSANQVQVQRLLTVKNVQRSRRALFLSIPMFVFFSLMSSLVGIVIYANLAGCDPLTSNDKPISSADKLLPYYVMKSLQHIPGLPGICVCGIFSAALSSISSAVNSLTAVTMEDFVKPFCAARKIHNWKVVMVAKAITISYGLIGLSLTFLVAKIGGLVQASYSIYGMFAGPVLGVFVLGMMTTRSNEKGIIVGLVTSIILTAWICLGASASGPPPETLPFSTANCSKNNLSEIIGTTSENVTEIFYETVVSITTYSTPFQEISNSSSVLPYSNCTNGEKKSNIFPLYTISYMWFTVIGFFASVFVGYVTSICINLFEGKSPTPQKDYLSPLLIWFLKKIDGNESENKQTKYEHHDENEETTKSFL